jgi:hypothetical protein
MKPGDEDDMGPTEGHKFYHNSIEHMVNERKAKQGATQLGDAAWDDDFDDVEDSFMSVDSLAEPHLLQPVERLSFEMWVSSPVDPDRALHHYTSLNSEKLAAMPLEDLQGWRLSFPHLQALVDRRKRLAACDLLLLNTSFKLMQEFPPRHSKLGIGLELKFSDSLAWPPRGEGTDFKKWTCTTYLYRDGVLISDPSREECQVSENWKVRPFFQSKWWASTFTSITEARKVAEDTKKPEVITQADEASCSFFRGLSIMQDISLISSADGWDTRQERRSRRAILLWKFSQAPGGSSGIATWQNLIAPPDRVFMNSPPPSGDMDLPPLSMDSIVSPGVVSFSGANGHFLSHDSTSYDDYSDIHMDPELGRDGFMSLKPEQIHDFSHLSSSFDLPNIQAYAGLDPSLHDTFNLHESLQETSNEHHTTANENIFESTRHVDEAAPTDCHDAIFDTSHGMGHSYELEFPSLSSFVRTTHQALQEQLSATTPKQGSGSASHSPRIKIEQSPKLSEAGTARTISQEFEEGQRILQALSAPDRPKLAQADVGESQWTPGAEQDEEALRSALLAASAMGDVGSPAQSLETPRARSRSGSVANEQQRDMHGEPHWVSPIPLRPTLHSFHSFPGVRNTDQSHHHQFSFGAGAHHSKHQADGLSLSHFDFAAQSHLHGFTDYQLSAISAPDDFLHASGSRFGEAVGRSTDDSEAVDGVEFVRAHSEPDPSLAAAIESFSGDATHVPGSFDLLEDCPAPESFHAGSLGSSFVEVAMELHEEGPC